MTPRISYLLATTAAILLLSSATASAQYYNNDNSVVMQRMDKIESNLMLLQRQIARGGNGGDMAVSSGDMSGAGVAQMQARIADIEEQMRRLQGMIEENNFQNRQLTERMDKMTRDLEYRLSALERPGMAPSATPSAQTPATATQAVPSTPTYPVAPATTMGTAPTPTPVVPSGTLQVPDPNAPQPDDSGNATFATPHEHYNYAFKLLNQTKYDAAAKSFEKFIATYPNDPLTGNAYYWLGETDYIRRDYIKAADYFRQGFEAAPTGPKAADNLLKLSMSLSAIDRTKEACVVLNQLLVKFGNNSNAIKQKTQQEINRLGCK